jgi:phenylpyruvate tautomerase PptA (4-oxalocrotonate tautomerase family)
VYQPLLHTKREEEELAHETSRALGTRLEAYDSYITVHVEPIRLRLIKATKHSKRAICVPFLLFSEQQ